jgi:hypothetical protein
MTLVPSTIIAIQNIKDSDDIQKLKEFFKPEPFQPPTSELRNSKMARSQELITFTKNCSHSPATTKRIENAAEWLLAVLIIAEAPGIDIPD